MRAQILRSKLPSLQWRKLLPLNPVIPLQNLIYSPQQENSIPKLPTRIFSALSAPHPQTGDLTTANFKGFSRSYGGRSANKSNRWVDKNHRPKLATSSEEEEECNDGSTSDDIKEEISTDKEFDEEVDYWEEEEEDEAEAQIGDGGDGGGVVLNGISWGSKALAIAEEVLIPFKDDLKIFAFKVTSRGYIYIRLDKLSDMYGCPAIGDIETFNSVYATRVEEVGKSGELPDNLAIEVSSPGAERLVKVPDDLERFKDLPMYVCYVEETLDAKPGSKVQEGVFQLDCVSLELGQCTWKLANVKLNKEASGKGRSLNRKQRDWRLLLPFTSLRLVRLYMEG